MIDENNPLGWPADVLKAMEIFRPFALQKVRNAVLTQSKFVHYTSAATAHSIISKRRVWMRRATVQNDFSEIEFGAKCIRVAWEKHKGLFDSVFGAIDEKLPESLYDLLRQWEWPIRLKSFIVCLSEHEPHEDRIGRLSMWRAYGGNSGVAMVLNGAPMFLSTDALKAYSSPVAYHSVESFSDEFEQLILRARDQLAFLREKGADWVRNELFHTFHFAMLCTKHRGFMEEREWRVVQSPAFGTSDVLEPSIEVIAGVPQPILKISPRGYPLQGPRWARRIEAVGSPNRGAQCPSGRRRRCFAGCA